MASPRAWVLLLAVLAAACGSAGSQAGGVQIVDPSVRATPPGVPVTAAYLTIDNRGGADDRLLSVDCPAAGEVQVHETMEEEGVVRMLHREEGLAVQAGATVALEPGGSHLMLMQLTGPLEAGSSVPLQLHFRHAGTIHVAARVTAP